MGKKMTRLQKSTTILSTAKATQWCYVDTNNQFNFMNKVFKISEKVEEYRVVNKAGEVEDFTNESLMDEILAVIGQDGFLKFYNQNYDLVEEVFVFSENK